jgi:hypothetical protein
VKGPLVTGILKNLSPEFGGFTWENANDKNRRTVCQPFGSCFMIAAPDVAQGCENIAEHASFLNHL